MTKKEKNQLFTHYTTIDSLDTITLAGTISYVWLITTDPFLL